MCEQLWPTISAMYFPWIAPYWTDKLAEPAATWIQQLTDDRSVLPPWIAADNAHAQRMVGMFVECVRFMLDTLPGKETPALRFDPNGTELEMCSCRLFLQETVISWDSSGCSTYLISLILLLRNIRWRSSTPTSWLCRGCASGPLRRIWISCSRSA